MLPCMVNWKEVGALADWDLIRTEYITTDTSYRALAEKYGACQSTVAYRAKKEDWAGARRGYVGMVQEKTLEALAAGQVRRAERLQAVADRVMDRLSELLEQQMPDARDLRQITAALKDLKAVQMLQSEADAREQEARIARLQRDARGEDTDTAIEVVWGEMPGEGT